MKGFNSYRNKAQMSGDVLTYNIPILGKTNDISIHRLKTLLSISIVALFLFGTFSKNYNFVQHNNKFRLDQFTKVYGSPLISMERDNDNKVACLSSNIAKPQFEIQEPISLFVKPIIKNRYPIAIDTINIFENNGQLIKELPSNNNLVVKTTIQDGSKETSQPLVPFSPESKVEFTADINEGEIGSMQSNSYDSPSDNIFNINIDQLISENKEYYLVYECFGIDAEAGAIRSINDRPSYAGKMLKKNNAWISHKEVIHNDWLNSGFNTIKFFSPSEELIHYKIRNVRIVKQDRKNREIVLSNNEIRYTSKGEVYIHGILNNSCNGIFINTTKVDVTNNEFETYYKPSEVEIKQGFIPISYTGIDGLIKSELVMLSPMLQEADFKFNIEKSSKAAIKNFNVGEAGILSTESAEIIISNTSLTVPTQLSITPLRGIDITPLGMGMINITKGKKALRCLPHGIKFASPVTIKLPYDEKLIPNGYSYKDIKSFYFNNTKKQWEGVKIDSIDEKNKTVFILTDHFSDYINGIIQTPESPSAAAFTPTTMSGIKNADPLAGINLMSPPSPSQKGDATVSYPLNIPVGRAGMQPNLGLSYSSDGGSGWLGLGWNLATAAVTIDTRWGSPVFDIDHESEIYLLNGEQLMYDDKYLPNRHDEDIAESTGVYTVPPQGKDRLQGSVRLYQRKLGSFDKIERIGTGTDSYVWKVTSTNGITNWYGGYVDMKDEYTIRTEEGNVVYWALARTQDPSGNYIEYVYEKSQATLYLKKIRYTGLKGGDAPTYEMTFNSSQKYDQTSEIPIREDVNVNGRLGLKQVDDRLLNEIIISHNQEGQIRRYQFGYKNGEFNKTLLALISEFDSKNALFYTHSMDYYNDLPECGQVFGEPITVTLPKECKPCGPDTDLDGVGDDCDNCPFVYNPLQDGFCLESPCGTLNSDSDPIPDGCDNCPKVSNGTQLDNDFDGIGDLCDNCINDRNVNQANQDGDKYGDACDRCKNYKSLDNEIEYDNNDSDGDGLGIKCDNCPNHQNVLQLDTDQDGIGDACDNCKFKSNKEQHDGDGDGIGFLCDNCPYDSNFDQLDSDEDGIGNVCDPCPTDINNSCCLSYTVTFAQNCSYSLSYEECSGINITETNTGNSFGPFCARNNSVLINYSTAEGTITEVQPCGGSSASNCYTLTIPRLSDRVYEINDTNPASPTYLGGNPIPGIFNTVDLNGLGAFINVFSAQHPISTITYDSDHIYITINTTFIYSDLKIRFATDLSLDQSFTFSPCIGSKIKVVKTSKDLVHGLDNSISNFSKNEKLESLIKTTPKFDKYNSKLRQSFECPSILNFSSLLDLINVDGYIKTKSALGTFVTKGGTIGGGVGVGLGCPWQKKGGKVSGDFGIGYSYNHTKGGIVNVDINGDGLSDIVMRKEDGILVYYPHKTVRNLEGKVTEHYFGEPLPFVNLADFYFGESDGWNYNLSVSFGSKIGGNVGFNIADGTSHNTIYLVDGNGDQLPDISINGMVLFNHIDNGKPTFTPNSDVTENLVIKGSTLYKTEATKPEAHQDITIPAMDVVKVWEANADGNIIIENINSIDAGAKISIETDNNGIYGYYPNGYVPNVTKAATCRLFANDAGVTIPAEINDLPSPTATFGLKCSPTGISPCPNADCEGCNNDNGLGCTPCLLDNPRLDQVANGQIELEEASNLVIPKNKISSGGLAIYHGGNGVSMEQDAAHYFEVESGASYLAFAADCYKNYNPYTDGSNIVPVLSSDLYVKKGQRIYFRLHAKKTGENPEITWNPLVKYVNVSNKPVNPDAEDQNGLKPYTSSYSDGFILNSRMGSIIPFSGQAGAALPQVTISWPQIKLQGNSDAVILRITQINTHFADENDDEGTETESTYWELPIPANSDYSSGIPTLPNFMFPQDFTQPDFTSLRFEAFSTSNIDWQSLEWNPVIKVENIEPNLIQGVNHSIEYIYPVIQYSAYKPYNTSFDQAQGSKVAGYNTINAQLSPVFNTYYIYPRLDNELENNLSGCQANCVSEIYFVVKQNGVVIGNAIPISVDNSGDFEYNSSPIQVNISDEASKYITIELYADGNVYGNDVLRKLDTPANYHRPIAYISHLPSIPGNVANNSNYLKITRRNVNLYHISNDPAGTFYRSWGQFLYDEAKDKNGSVKPIAQGDNFGRLINLLKKPEDNTNQGQLDYLNNEANITNLSNLTPEQIQNVIQSNIAMPELLYVYPFPFKQEINGTDGVVIKEKYRGYSAYNFASKYTGRALDMKQAILESLDDPRPSYSFLSSDYGMCSTPDKEAISYSKSVSGGFSAGFGTVPKPKGSASVGVSTTLESYSQNLSDFFDINGDRYPDVIFSDYVQVTKATGGLYSQIEKDGNLPVFSLPGEFDISSTNWSASGTYSRPGEATTASNSPRTKVFLEFGKSQTSASLSGNTSNGESKTDILWIDTNGDGLNDRIDKSGEGAYLGLNLGNGQFNLEESTPSPFISNIDKNSTFGGGIGLSLFQGNSLAGGFSAAWSTASAVSALRDINGDGLVDVLYKPFFSSDIGVFYNDGSGIPNFNFEHFCPINFNLSNHARSTENSKNLTLTFAIIIPLPFECIKIPINFNGAPFTVAQNNTEKTIEDYDGDGFPDFLEQDEETLTVRHSLIRRTNKLETIHTPIGGEFTVDYKVAPPSYNMPNGKWVVSNITVHDTKNNDGTTLTESSVEGVGTFRKYYEFHNGKYDRREREFNGFKFMRVIDRDDPMDETSAIYRQSVSQYNNESYYLKGALEESYTIQGELDMNAPNPATGAVSFDFANAAKSSSTINTYKLFRPKVIEGESWTMDIGSIPSNELLYDIGGTKGLGCAYAKLIQTTSLIYEGTNSMAVTETMEYDDLGRLEKITHSGGNNYTSIISYHGANAYNMINIPAEIKVIEGGQVVRKRSIDSVTSLGQIAQINVYYTADDKNTTTLGYDGYGNLKTIIMPADANGTSVTKTYDYDNVQHQFITQITESDGSQTFTSSSVQEPKFGNIMSTTDISGETVSYDYDDKGRLIWVRGPKESDYTLTFEYHPFGDKPYAITNHFDPFGLENGGGDITTVTISNGLGEVIQVIKDSNINGEVSGAIATGNAIKDKYGRIVRQYQPSPTYSGQTVYVGHTNGIYSEVLEYDIKDRPMITEDEANTATSYSYNIENDLRVTISSILASNGTDYITTKELKDVDGRTKETWTNDKNVSYKYDGIGQLITTTDEEGRFTRSVYDNFGGRRIIWEHPDAGKIYYTYDKLGRMTEMVTPNFGQTNNKITYEYDAFSRIKAINYPDYTTGGTNINNVKYEYYDASGNGTNNGRLKRIDDASGAQQMEYGRLGEVTRVLRAVAVPNYGTKVFETNFTYDSWNRVNSITYPGNINIAGEVVFYKYDSGGNLTAVNNDAEEKIISRIYYDQFGQKSQCVYGNGVVTNYTYTDELRRLATMNINNGDMLSNTYKYDHLGNITLINNLSGGSNSLGGQFTHKYSHYDNFNRLESAHGTFTGNSNQFGNSNANYELNMTYEGMHRISSKGQSHSLDGQSPIANNYQNNYSYGDSKHPNAVTSIANQSGSGQANQSFTYDLNGNTLVHSIGLENKYFLWDEANRLKALRMSDESLQYNIYDAGGERILKGMASLTNLYQNGDPSSTGGPTSETEVINAPHADAAIDGFTKYVNGYFVVDPHNQVTKHYYAGSERIMSRLAGNVANFETSGLDVDGDLKGKLEADINFTNFSLNVNIKFGDPSLPYQDCNELQGEALKQCICEQNNDCQALNYYFHPDHIGSSTFLTDINGQPYQFLLYLPFGETMAEQNVAGYSTPYRFTGKELDEETGLYYFGARYYDPSLSIWHGVDAMTGNYPDMSPYLYTANNPINRIDPDGNDWYQDECGNYKWFEGKGNQNGYIRVNEGHEYEAFDGRRVVLSNENRNWSYKQTPYSFSKSETMKNLKTFGEMKIVNGIKNTFFGVVGLIGSVMYMAETFTVGAALGGTTAFTLSAAEVGIGLGQIGDAINPKEENQIIHNYSSLPGLVAGKLNSPYSNQIDAIGGLIPGAVTGGNFDSYYGMFQDYNKLSAKQGVNQIFQGIDAEEDMRAGENSINDIIDKKRK